MPSGALQIDATPTRTGVLTYRTSDGQTIRELRHPSEVFNAKSLASLADVPVTVDHPDGPVTPDTWRDVTVGHVSGPGMPSADGRHVGTRLVVHDAAAIADVTRPEGDPERLIELSCGYTCDLDETPGVYEGEHYDAIQRNIVQNHVALLRAGEGRCGPSASMRWDSKAAVCRVDSDVPAAKKDSGNPPARKDDTVKDRIDGVDYDVGTPAHMQALARQRAAFEAAATEATKRADALAGEAAAAKTALDSAKASLAKAIDPKAIAALVKERSDTMFRLASLCRSKGVTLDATVDPVVAASGDLGGTVRAVLEKLFPGQIPTGASDDFVGGFLTKAFSDLAADETAEGEPLDARAPLAPLPGAPGAPPRLDSATRLRDLKRADVRGPEDEDDTEDCDLTGAERATLKARRADWQKPFAPNARNAQKDL